jgi:hypothetical protein
MEGPPPSSYRVRVQSGLMMLRLKIEFVDVWICQILLQKSAYRRRGTDDTIFLKPSVATRWIVRAAYARLY